ncbi:MAG: RluA family pseudouridine synthase [Kiloniellaceae bacterium]
MSQVRTITVQDDEADQRLDRWFRRRFPALGHGRLERLLRTGQVRVDGRRARSGTRLAPGQVVRVPPLPEPAAAPRPARPRPVAPDEAAALRATVLFKDDWVIAIDKPAGLAVQGGTGQRRHLDAMLEALRFEGAEPPRLAHRLDKDTSGVLLLARTAAAARRLSAAFKGKRARKVYWALTVGVPARRRGRIDLPLAKRPGPAGEKVGAAGDAGKPALTLYEVVEDRALGQRGPRVAWLVLVPLTGRTHQLRAHCAALGTPILGDGKYGGKQAFPDGLPFAMDRLTLHAREIALPHPEDGTTLRVTAPLPPHMAAAWSALGLDVAKADRAADDLLDYAAGLAHSPPGSAARAKRRRGGRSHERRLER